MKFVAVAIVSAIVLGNLFNKAVVFWLLQIAFSYG